MMAARSILGEAVVLLESAMIDPPVIGLRLGLVECCKHSSSPLFIRALNRERQYMRVKNSGRGRPRVDSEEARSRLSRDVLDGIDAFAANEPDRPARPEAIRRIVRDWLTTHAYLKAEPEVGTRPEDLNASNDD